MQLTTSEEKRIQRIKQLKAKLQKEEAKLNENERKKRNGRLVSLGILFEKTIPEMSQEHLSMWIRKADGLPPRNKARVLEAFELGKQRLKEQKN